MYTPLSNHTVVVAVRWLTLAVTALLLIWQQRPVSAWLAMAVLSTLALSMTIVMQTVARWTVRYPALIAIDVLIAAGVVSWSSPWGSPFYPYMIAVLVLPALVSGWRGGVLAGMLFSSLVATLQYMVSGMPIVDPQASWDQLVVVYAMPTLLGAAMPSIVHGLQRAFARPKPQPSPLVLPPLHNLSELFRDSLPDRRRVSGGASGQSATSVAPRIEELRIALYTPLVDEDTLMAELTLLADRFEQHALIATRVVVLGRPQPVQSVHLPLVRRVVIEALLNVEQHAQAQSVSLMVRFDQRSVTIMVQDDGQGLPATGIQRAGLHSLRALMYRCSEVGGRLEVFDNVSSGVAVRLILPLVAQDVL